MSLANALRARLTRRFEAPSGLHYEVGAVVSADTLLSRAPILLAAVSGQAKAPAATERAAKATIDALYVLACAGVTAYSVDGAEWIPCRLVEEPTGADGECAVAALPLDDLTTIAEVVSEVSGLGAHRRSLQPPVVDGAGRGGAALRDRPVDGGGVDTRPAGSGD